LDVVWYNNHVGHLQIAYFVLDDPTSQEAKKELDDECERALCFVIDTKGTLEVLILGNGTFGMNACIARCDAAA
jgi:hypothetical protein